MQGILKKKKLCLNKKSFYWMYRYSYVEILYINILQWWENDNGDNVDSDVGWRRGIITIKLIIYICSQRMTKLVLPLVYAQEKVYKCSLPIQGFTFLEGVWIHAKCTKGNDKRHVFFTCHLARLSWFELLNVLLNETHTYFILTAINNIFQIH